MPDLCLCVNKTIDFVYLSLDNYCLKAKKKGECINKEKGFHGLNWSKICAKACGDKDVCPAREDHPSEQLRGEFHILIALQ